MKVILNQGGSRIDITNATGDITVQGDYQQVARQAEFNIIRPQWDKQFPTIKPEIGNMVQLLENDVEVFQGIIFVNDSSLSNQQASITCLDGLVYFTHSDGYYNFKNETPESITQKLCSEFGVPAGSLASTGVPVTFVANGMNIYDIMMKAYTKAAEKNGKKYFPIMQNGSLEVWEKGDEFVNVTLDYTILQDVQYKQSIEDMKNKIIIYGDEDPNTGVANVVATAKNDDWISSYGILQHTQNASTDTQDHQAEANILLKGMTKDITLTCLGNVHMITGRSIQIVDDYHGLNTKAYIQADTHTWSNGIYTTQLTISLNNDMDIIT